MTRRRRTLTTVAIVLAVVLAAASVFVVGRHLVARAALARVTVTPSAMTCDDKPVPLALGDTTDENGNAASFGGTDDDEPPTPELRPPLSEKTTCLLSIAVANPGRLPVTVTSLTFPQMFPGDRGYSAFEAGSTTDLIRPRTLPESSEHSGDAVFDIGERIEAHSWTELSFNLNYRASYASCSDSLIGQSELPVVRVTSAGASRAVVGDVRLTFNPPRTDANRDSCG